MAPPGALSTAVEHGPRRWRARAPSLLHWREWGGESVVFDARDGQTHLLSPLAAAVMAWLEEQPRSLTELTAAMAADLGVAADDNVALQQPVGAAIDQLRELGWIVAEPGADRQFAP